MSGDDLLQLGVAAGVTLALIGISALLGAWRSIKIDEQSARDRITFDEPDFRIDALLIGTDGRSAVALDEARGEGVLVFALGDGLATRRFRLGAIDAVAVSTRLKVTLRDVSKWRVEIIAPGAGAAEEWARRIAGAPLGSGHAVS